MASIPGQSLLVDVTSKAPETFFVIYRCDMKTGCAGSDKYTDVSLTLLLSDLVSVYEVHLQKLIIQRLSKGLYIGSWSIDSADLGIPGTTNGKSAFYHCVIVTDGNNPDGDVPSADKKKDTFVVCFLANEKLQLELFQVDLDMFAFGVIKDFQEKNFHADDATKRSIQQWYTVSIEYLTRCINLLKNNVKFLIHAALLDCTLCFRGCTVEQEEDILRFFQSCNLSELLIHQNDVKQHENSSLSGSMDMLVDVGAGGNQSDVQDIVVLNITENGVTFEPTGCTRFCEEWSKTLNDSEYQKNSSVQLKQIIEAFKLKFIQSVNTLKRLIREAENDFYALYRAYVFLRDSGNSSILLHYAKMETSPYVASVVSVLDEFIRKTGS